MICETREDVSVECCVAAAGGRGIRAAVSLGL